MNATELAHELMNIGPTMAGKLIHAGIDSRKKLEQIGAEKAFVMIHESGGFCGKFNAVYLYGLQGAIQNCEWHKIPETKKQQFKKFTETLRNN